MFSKMRFIVSLRLNPNLKLGTKGTDGKKTGRTWVNGGSMISDEYSKSFFDDLVEADKYENESENGKGGEIT